MQLTLTKHIIQTLISTMIITVFFVLCLSSLRIYERYTRTYNRLTNNSKKGTLIWFYIIYIILFVVCIYGIFTITR